MRVLFTAVAGTGHFHPLVPIAKALQQAGHEVAFAVAPSFQPMVEHSGFRTFPAGTDFSSLQIDPSTVQQRQAQLAKAGPQARSEMFIGMFVRHFARKMLPDLLKVASEWHPDLIIRETGEFAGGIAAEKLGIPYASIQVGGGRMSDHDPQVITTAVNELRADVGLPPDTLGMSLFRYLHLSFMPAVYFGGAAQLPPTTHFLRTTTFDRSGTEELPAWVDTLRQGGRPIVYATLGTVFNKLIHHLGTIVAGLRDEPVELVVTVGRDMDPALLGPQPSNVHVERYIPQSLLLPHCALAIMHGGYNSVMSALSVGLPVIIVPLAADQPMNAARTLELGAGLTVTPEELTPDSIRRAAREVLNTASYREAARRFQAEALSLPDTSHGVKLLERLAAEKRPLPSAT